MQAILERNQINTLAAEKNNAVFGDKIGALANLFGCWHTYLSRPFTSGKTAYRACTTCGARKHFDQKSLRTFGPFHFPPSIPNIKSDYR